MNSVRKDLIRPFFVVFGSTLLLISSSLVPKVSHADQSAQARVVELFDCLQYILSKEEDLASVPFLSAHVDGASDSCTTAQVSAYKAKDKVSYAMGVSLQRKLLREHETLNWVDFINGLVRAENEAVKASNTEITLVLEAAPLGEAEASQKYLERIAASEDVEEVSGVYFKKVFLPKTVTSPGTGDVGNDKTIEDDSSITSNFSIWKEAFFNMSPCPQARGTGAVPIQVLFHLVKPINRDISKEDIVDPEIRCIAYHSDEVIRGWRLVVDELDNGAIYDVLIPNQLAYGTTGVQGVVDSGENLRFLMQVIGSKK